MCTHLPTLISLHNVHTSPYTMCTHLPTQCAHFSLHSSPYTMCTHLPTLISLHNVHTYPYTMCTRIRGLDAKHSRPTDADDKKVRHHNSFSQKLPCLVINETRGQLHIYHTAIRFLPNLFLTTSHYQLDAQYYRSWAGVIKYVKII
jgi:hypothetical protein